MLEKQKETNMKVKLHHKITTKTILKKNKKKKHLKSIFYINHLKKNIFDDFIDLQ